MTTPPPRRPRRPEDGDRRAGSEGYDRRVGSDTGSRSGSRSGSEGYDRRRAAYEASARDQASTGGRAQSRRRAEAARARRRRRRTLTVLGALVVVVVVPVVLAGGWFWLQVQPRGAQGPEVELVVQDGWKIGRVSDELAAADVVGSASAFRLWSSISSVGSIQPGRYTFHTNMGGRAAANVLKVGPEAEAVPDLTLLVPPGLSVGQIADRVGQLPGHSRDGFLAAVNSGSIRSKYQPAGVTSLEGFLFPDTYRIAATDDDAAVARRLVAQFDAVGDRIGLANSAATNGRTPYETVIIASLIQNEAKLAEDAPLISAVVRNRLRDGMQLQIDATLCYAKGGCPPVPTEADKSINSPYNTYRIPALPPTPIANVTQVNLDAALHPANVTYKYYVLSEANGKHAFADTLAQHEANIRAARAKGVL